ncbi:MULTISPECIES: hypothetical protein [Kitasatospora]|uniref:hypothetical protein n=1 Tax=Kitasatospora TaxID=2063 RepID=UPI000ADA996C|nr:MULTISPECIES: hypothetical protein [Kitasatospora]
MTTPIPAKLLTGATRRPGHHPVTIRTACAPPAQPRTPRHHRTAPRGAVPDPTRGER